MIRRFVSRASWIFTILGDAVALASFIELNNPREKSMAYIWNGSFNLATLALGVACISVIIAAISMLWTTPSVPRAKQLV